jgi:ubiquinone/menaquinone biosynthesis C-methylase UbiE
LKNNYDKIAAGYDLLSRLVFGSALIHAQTCMLHLIAAHSRILIVGGGTGWILEELAKVHADGLQIIYVELSAEMIAHAKRRNWQQNEVVFINEPIEHYSSTAQFDVIFTAFLFDNFTLAKATLIFTQLDEMLMNKGKWLFTDFHSDQRAIHVWQRILLKIMFLFFQIVCKIEAKELTNMVPLFAHKDYRQLLFSKRYKGFIQSFVYEKNSCAADLTV